MTSTVASKIDVEIKIGVKVEKKRWWWNKYINELYAYRAYTIEESSKLAKIKSWSVIKLLCIEFIAKNKNIW